MSGLSRRVVRRDARLEYEVDVLNDLVELRVEDESDLHLALSRECLGGWIEALTEARDRLEAGDPAT